MMIIAGTVKNAVQLQALNSKWQQKKESGNVLTKEERNERANWTPLERMKHDFEEQAAQNREAGKRSEITSKIMYGGTLTPEEEKYLEQEDPSALQKYKQIKAEKKAYEEKLRKCKTKDEVQRLKTETLGQYAASMKKIENNPYIPISAKLAKAQELLAKVQNIQEAERKFMVSPEFKILPTEAEEAKQRSEESTLENGQNREMIREAAPKEEVPQVQEETLPGGEETPDLQEDGAQPRKITSKDADYFREIEDSYRRMQFNVRLMDEGKASVTAEPERAAAERTVGRKVNVSI